MNEGISRFRKIPKSEKTLAINLLVVLKNLSDNEVMNHLVASDLVGYKHVIATTMGEALQYVKQQSFDVILTDHLLSDASGLDLIHAVPHTPVIIIVPAGEETCAVQAMQSGAKAYVIKDRENGYLKLLPFTIQQVVAQQVKSVDQTSPQSEEMYRTISELSSDYAFLYRVDADGKIHNEWASASYTRITGYPLGEPKGNTLYGLYVPEDRERVQSDIQLVIQGQTVEGDYRILDKQGEERWLHITRRPIWDEHEKHVIKFIGAAQDITARKRAEEALKQKENYLRSLVDSQTAFNMRVDMSGNICYCNHRYQQHFGWGTISPIGMSALESIAPEDHEKTLNAVSVCLTNPDKPVRVELRKPSQDGNDFWTVWEFIAILDFDGAINEIQCVGFDITEQKQAEARLIEANALLEQRVNERTLELESTKNRIEAIFNYSGDGIVLIDIADGILQANKAFDNLFAIPADAYFGKSLATFFEGEQAAKVEATLQEVATSQIKRQIEVQTHCGAVTRDVEISIAPINHSERYAANLVCIIRDISERKFVENELAYSENRYRIISEMMSDYAFALDIHPDGSTSYAWMTEDSFGRLTGYRHEDLINNFKLYHPDDAERASKDFERTVQGETTTGEYRIVTRSGELRWIRMQRRLEKGYKAGDLPRLYGVAEDITERKQAEAALLNSENRYRIISEMMSDYAFALDIPPDGEMYYAWMTEDSFKRVTGYDYKEVKDNLRLYHPDDSDQVWDDFRRAIKGESNSSEYRIITQSGDIRWLHVQRRPEWDTEKQRVRMVYGVAKDITERKRAELAVAEERNLLRTVIDAVPDFIFVKNREREYVLANESYAKWLGLNSPSNVVGKMVTSLLSSESVDQYNQHDEILFATGQPHINFEEHTANRHGQDQWLLTTKVPLRNLDGELIGLVGITRDITAIKSSEELMRASEKKLRESQKMLHQVLDTIPVRVFWKNVDSVVVGCNRLFAQDCGFDSVEAYLAKEREHLVFRTAQNEHYAVDDLMIMSSGLPKLDFEETFIKHDRSEMVIQTSKLPLRNEQGVIIGTLGVFTDITARKETETALAVKHEEERQMQAYLKALHEITLELTATETLEDFYRKVVEAGLQHFGFERVGLLLYDAKLDMAIGCYGTDVNGNPVDESHLRIDSDHLPNILKQTLDRNNRFVVDREIQLYTNFEPTGHGTNAVAALWDEEAIGWLAVDNQILHKPITHAQLEILALYALTVASLLIRKKAEQRTLALSRRLDLATRAGGIGVWEWNLKDNRLILDPMMLSLYGLKDTEFSGSLSDWSRIVHEEDYSAVTNALNAALLGGKDYDIEFRIVMPDASIRHLKGNAMVLRTADGTPERVVGVNIDISDMKRSAERLQLALEQEKELGELKSRFVSMASHEFRTPLAAILATTETLSNYRDRMNAVQIEARLEKIRQQVAHMKDIMEDVLQLSRIQAGKVEFCPDAGDLNALCQDIIEEFDSQTLHHGRIVYQCSQAVVFAQFDKRMMRQVITNLISNGLKYSTPHKLINVNLTQDEAQVILTVTDHGIGIPTDDLKYLFEPFHRAKNVGTISGTGLGLSITKQAVEMHGGTILLDSHVEVGTTFTVTLPNVSIKEMNHA